MLRVIAIAAMFALAVPTLAVAQGNNQHHPAARKASGPPHPVGPPHPGAAPHAKPLAVPHGLPHGPIAGPPHPVGPVGHFSYGGHMINQVHLAPFIYPPGWAYRQWTVGAVLPPFFLVPAYYYADWAALGLAPPQPGYQWVRYGPDLLLVDTTTGQVVDVAYGVLY